MKRFRNSTYYINEKGVVYNTKTKKFLKPQVDKDGYLRVTLFFGCRGSRKRYYVHRMVAECYIPCDRTDMQINHKNQIKNDNRVENLEWVTPSKNINYGDRNKKVSESLKGKRHYWSWKKSRRCMYKNKIYDSLKEIAKVLNLSYTYLRDIMLRDKNKNKYGIIYVDEMGGECNG